MSTTIYLLEPQATPPPPRAVRTSTRARLLLVCGTALFAAIIFGGVTALLEAGKVVWLSVAGRTITAHVTALVEAPEGAVAGQPPTASPHPVAGSPSHQAATAHSSGRHYTLTYVFDHPTPGGFARSSTVHFDLPDNAVPSASGHAGPAKPLPMVRVGDALAFRYAVVAGRPTLQPWGGPPIGNLVLLIAMAVILVAVGGIFMKRLFNWHRKRVRLLRHGIAVTGAVASKRVDSLEGKLYVKYTYRRQADAIVNEREEQCTPTQWKLFKDGDPVTVLYDPDKLETVGLFKLLSDP